MTAQPTQQPAEQDTDATREEGSSAPTWEYGAPDLGIGYRNRTQRSEVSE